MVGPAKKKFEVLMIEQVVEVKIFRKIHPYK